jgi:hypothetical protein
MTLWEEEELGHVRMEGDEWDCDRHNGIPNYRGARAIR